MSKLLFAAAGLTLAAPAMAHHSQAMFNLDKKITVQATVKEFQYTNPHSWLIATAPGPDGKGAADWSFESTGPLGLSRVGVKAKTFAPGDKVAITANPMKDGRPGGLLVAVRMPDGHNYVVRPDAGPAAATH